MLLALSPALRRPDHNLRRRPEVRFHYSSMAARNLPRADLAAIVHASWRNNWRFGITGWLRFDGQGFEQVMEGEAEPVAYLAASILADTRHEAIDVKTFSLIEGRCSDRWIFEGFETILRPTGLPADCADPTNLIRARFGRRD